MRLHIPGASPEDLARGVAAAAASLASAGVSPFEGAAAVFKQEGPGDLSEDDGRAIDAWSEAEGAAIIACCGGGCTDHDPDHDPDHDRALELAPSREGELWVGQRPSGRWIWEVLIEPTPEGTMGRWFSEAGGVDYEAEDEARAAGEYVLETVRAQLLR